MIMRLKNSYYIKQYRPDHWHVCCLSNNHPVYDNSTNEDGKPLVFKDEDFSN